MAPAQASEDHRTGHVDAWLGEGGAALRIGGIVSAPAVRLARRVAARATAVVMTASLLAAVELAASAAPTAGVATATLPPLPTTAAPAQAPVIPAGDFSDPPGSPEASLPPAPIVPPGFTVAGRTLVDRNPTTDVYDNHDGTRTALIHTGPVNWRDGQGVWRTIDPRLTQHSGGAWHNNAGPVDVAIASATGAGPLVSLAGPGWSVAADLPAAAPGRASAASGNAARFAGVFAGVDLQEEVGNDRVKETFTLAGPPPQPLPSTLRFPLILSGVTPSTQADGSIAFTDAGGTVVAAMPVGLATDASRTVDAGGLTPRASVVPTLVRVDGGWAVDLQLPTAWLADPTRVYPVAIDPTTTFEIDAGMSAHAYPSTSGFDENVGSGCGNCFYDGTSSIEGSTAVNRIGYEYFDGSNPCTPGAPGCGFWQFWSYLHFNVDEIKGHAIRSGFFKGYAYWGGTFRIYPSADWATGMDWDHRAGHMDATYVTQNYADDSVVSFDMTGWVAKWAQSTNAWGPAISMDTAGDTTQYVRLGAMEQAWEGTDPYAEVTFDDQPPSTPTLSSPADQTVTVSPTPKLIANATTDPETYNGAQVDGVQYWFTVSGSGAQAQSGWISSPDWTVPANVLHDGVTYTWNVTARDTPWGNPSATSATRTFKVDQRLGDNAVVPYDSMGPVSVNLFNGNAVVHAASPKFSTVGGSVGLNFTYNSQAQQISGLTGSYASNCSYTTTPWPAFSLIRRDASINFNWGTGSPGSVISTDSFCARWTGYVSVPVSGTYSFGTIADDGTRIWVNGTQVLNNWVGQGAPASPQYSGAVTLTANTPVPIQVDYFEGISTASVALYARSTALNGNADTLVDPTWLSTDAPALPKGWTVSTDLDGDLTYVRARVNEAAVTLVDDSGMTHTYTQVGTSYKPPANEDGVLTKDAATGVLTFHDESGTTYTFNADGTLNSATSGTDDRTPAAPQYAWSGSPSRLRTITDPVSGKTTTLRYQGTDACPTPPSGFDAAPATMLCQVQWFDGSVSDYWYKAGLLARIEDPGDAGNTPLTDFGYTSGALTTVRDPLQADAVRAHAATDDNTSRTVIAYTDGKVSSVTLATPASGGAPRHAYAYGTQTATVSADGLTAPLRRVTMDPSGRLTDDTDADNHTTHEAWDGADHNLSSTDAAGRMTTRIYDSAQRVTDVYGPAPSACFNASRLPISPPPTGCPALVPHTSSVYDGGMVGLGASYWQNTTLTGSPYEHATGSGTSDGAVNSNWGTGAVPLPAGLTAGSWSARYTGDLVLPTGGNTVYYLQLYLVGYGRLWFDDQLAIDSWAATNTATVSWSYTNATANSRHRIRIEFRPTSATLAQLVLKWSTTTPTATSVVDGTDLAPRYGLTTKTTTDDGTAGSPAKVTTTAFAAPENSLPTSVTDAAGISTATTYELVGSAGGYLRPTVKTLPGGNTTTYTYYPTGAGGQVANPCGSGTFDQMGRVRLAVGSDPTAGTANAGRAEEYVYDGAGRVIASRVDANPSALASAPWTCTTYDIRGRPSTKSIPALYGQPARTVTWSYAEWDASLTPAGNNPLHTSVGDAAGTIHSAVDLLGRTVSYTDAWGDVTQDTAYDQAGRLIDETGPAGAKHLAYDDSSRLTSEKLDGLVVAQPAYDANGEMSSVSYPSGTGNGGNGTSVAVGRDSAGRTSSLTWGLAGATTVSDTVTYSQSGRVVTDDVSDAGVPSHNSFVYDSAGRLTSAAVAGHSYSYAYASSSPACVFGAAGLNSNRTSVTRDGVTATSCYDYADRLVSTQEPGFGGIAYDNHGNVTTMGSQTFAYDGADRQVSTANAGGNFVRYDRDATDRVIARTVVSPIVGHGSASASNGAGGTSLVLPKPAGAVAGDVLLAQVTVGSSTTTVTPPAGWTAVDATGNGTILDAVYWHAAGASEPASYTFSLSANKKASGGVAAYSGVSASAPVAAHAATSYAAATGSPSAPAVSPGVGGARVVALFGLGAAVTATPPPGLAEQWDVSGSNAAASEASDRQLAFADSSAQGPLAASLSAAAVAVAHTVLLAPAAAVARYGFSGPGDSPSFTVDASTGAVGDRYVGLPGGAVLTRRAGADVWTYPNVHGDALVTADAGGARQGAALQYEPFGSAVGAALPDNAAGTLDYGWLGAKQRGTDHEAGSAYVEMGARLYSPVLGRFLEVDPVPGGSANDYDYCSADPMNCYDLTGLSGRTKRKQYQKRIRGLQAKIDEHEAKIELEGRKERPDDGVIRHWESEIRGWKEQIEEAQRHLNRRLYRMSHAGTCCSGAATFSAGVGVAGGIGVVAYFNNFGGGSVRLEI